MLLAGILRWIDINTESLWVDEIYSYRQAIKSVGSIIANAQSDVHPPVYYIFLHWWILLFGTDEAGLRGFSVFCGVAAVPLIYLLGKRLWNPRTGLIAAFLLTVSHFHIHYSQEARSYSYLVLVTIGGILAFMRVLDEIKNDNTLRWRTITLFLVANVLMLYSHFFALFVVVAQNVYIASLLVLKRSFFLRLWKRWFLLESVLLLLFVPWLNILYWQIRALRGSFWIDRPTPFVLVETLVEYAGSLAATAILLPLCILALVEIRKQIFEQKTVHIIQPSNPLHLWLLGLWLALPILIPYAQSLVGTPIYYVKYTIPALPAFLLLAAKGMDAWEWDTLGEKLGTTALVAAICLIAAYNTRNDWNALEKEPWRKAAQYLASATEQQDAIFVHDWYCLYNLAYYQSDDSVSSNASQYAPLQALPPERLRLTTQTWDWFYRSRAAKHDHIWLVLSHKTGKTQAILDTIEREFICTSDSVFPSRYRKYMVSDTFPLQTRGIFLMKTYLSNDIRIRRYQRRK
jgi:mannosyltransferase